jgi:hypothetical protein
MGEARLQLPSARRGVMFVNVEPLLKSLRQDPRYTDC